MISSPALTVNMYCPSLTSGSFRVSPIRLHSSTNTTILSVFCSSELITAAMKGAG